MRVLTGDAIDNILDLMNDKDFRKDIEYTFKDATEEANPVQIDEIYLDRLIIDDECIEVHMWVDMNVLYVNDRSRFLFKIDTDFNGEPL